MASCRTHSGVNPNVEDYGGGAEDYDEGELSNWQELYDVDLTAGGSNTTQILDVYAEGGGGGLWDDGDGITGATCDSTHFRVLRAASGNGHSGIPYDDGTIAGFRGNVAFGLLVIAEDYSQIQDLAGKNADASSRAFEVALGNTEGKIIGCLAFDTADRGFYSGGATVSYFINCLAHNCGDDGWYIGGGGTHYIYNCTEDGSTDKSIRIGTGTTVNSKNCVWDSAIHNSGTHNQTTNEGTGAGGSTPTYIGDPDFHLDPTDVVAIDNGTDLSADGNFPFDDDINAGVMGGGTAGQSRSGSWDIGFDEYRLFGYINIGDAWKNIESVQINIGDTWKDVAEVQINIGDAWKDA